MAEETGEGEDELVVLQRNFSGLLGVVAEQGNLVARLSHALERTDTILFGAVSVLIANTDATINALEGLTLQASKRPINTEMLQESLVQLRAANREMRVAITSARESLDRDQR